jgi:antitoxin component YwqK of YwqJK toxin-antitoxin module
MRLFLLLILSLSLFSCSPSSKEEKKENETEKKKELKDPELQNMMNQLNEETDENLADGFHELKYSNGQLKSTGTIANGKKEGNWTYYYESGTKWSECNFQAGVSHGKVVSYHPNGQVNYIGYFTGGEKSGIWQFYDTEGKLLKETDMAKKNSEK